MRKYLVFLVTLGLIASFSFNSFSKDIKIGYVDIVKVFNEYEKTKTYDQKLEDQKGEAEKKLSSKKEDIEKLQNKLELLKDEEKAKQEKNIAEKIKEYREIEQASLTKIREERDDRMKEIIEDINAVIKKYAEEKGFSVVLNSNSVLYGLPSMDVTSDIVKISNEKKK